MSTRTKKTTTTTPPSSATPDRAPAAPAAAPDGVSGAGVPALRNDNDTALWAALNAQPGATTAALAQAAGIGVSTARRVLSGWESAGAARSDRDPESPRAPKTWTVADPATPQPAAPESVTTEPAAAEPAPAPASSAITESAPADAGQPDTAVAAPTGDDRADVAPPAPAGDDNTAAAQPESTQPLPAGALRGLVEDYLRDHPGEDFSPHQIGKALDRSSGAVHNALVKLTTSGVANQTSTAPKRFTFAPA
ncbi:hypothetical protein NONI108955_44705 [Nocardia ninae]|uniref:Uncharacterized protein n=1 Tax=Nocardia ninae NBRC 108245 TaxID=1210091 RepID=A0A511MVF2_9NOCA|nr:hypothetical protein [Nocardia ninae]GEM44238.1 hypothetical protein NN4_87570 [Nocardia ninae NBRC 108245]